MVKYFIFFLLLSGHSFANNTILTLRSENAPQLKLTSPHFQLDDFKNDPASLVTDEFSIPDPFYEATSFWFNIYTNFTTDQVVLHHRDRPSIIFQVIDVTGLRDRTRANAIAVKRNELASLFDFLSKNDGKCAGQTTTINCQQLLDVLSKSGISPPTLKKEIEKYFQNLKSAIRSQSGQRDMILQGIHNLIPFEKKISQIFGLFEVPGELLAIAFLESSFNTRARSTAGAAGVWQFIRTTGSQYFSITQKHDDRLNPLISTLGALQLLKQNHRRAGRWDLAIWGYNSGLRHVLDAKKKLKKEDMDLHFFFENYSHRTIGFASRSFYPSFLALVYALAYKKVIYLDRSVVPVSSPLRVDSDNIKFYVFLCNTSPKFIFDSLRNTSPDLVELNSHIHRRYHSTNLPRGTIFVSDRPLTSRRYFEVPPQNYTNRYPKNWRLLLRNQSCSTR
jgi:membrane-bound lytic murein transglycosylase D